MEFQTVEGEDVSLENVYFRGNAEPFYLEDGQIMTRKPLKKKPASEDDNDTQNVGEES